MKIPPFHLAIPVYDIQKVRVFYGELLGCPEGRSDETWVDFNLFGHQLVAHYKPSDNAINYTNPVDGHHVPVPHFGVVLDWEIWGKFSERLKLQNISFIIEPYIRFKGKAGEQATMFFLDPFGNALEFKAFKDVNQLFAR